MTGKATERVGPGRPNRADEGGLPAGLAGPARRALAAAGYTRLEDLAGVGDEELLALHGMGSKALATLRRASSDRGGASRSDAGSQQPVVGS